jgi:hypothetical protein
MLNESASARIVAPINANVKFEVIAWTPSTKGKLKGSLVEVALPPWEPFPELGQIKQSWPSVDV